MSRPRAPGGASFSFLDLLFLDFLNIKEGMRWVWGGGIVSINGLHPPTRRCSAACARITAVPPACCALCTPGACVRTSAVAKVIPLACPTPTPPISLPIFHCRALRDKVPPGVYRSGARVVAVAADSASGVSVDLEGGERVSGDLLVGADGPGSLVRSHFCPGVRSKYQVRCACCARWALDLTSALQPGTAKFGGRPDAPMLLAARLPGQRCVACSHQLKACAWKMASHSQPG